jgi:hypothetical protein
VCLGPTCNIAIRASTNCTYGEGGLGRGKLILGWGFGVQFILPSSMYN